MVVAEEGLLPGRGNGTRGCELELSRRDILRAGAALQALALSLATVRRSRPAGGRPITFAFAGDTHFVDEWDTEGGAVYRGVPSLAAQLRANRAHVLAPVAPILFSADIAMVNLESAVTERGEPVPGKAFHFRSAAESFVALRAPGVNLATMANNHALDYGPVGMRDPFDAIAAYRFPVVGIGHDASEAFRPYRVVINGQRIAIFAAVDWLEPALVPQWTATDNRRPRLFNRSRPSTGRRVLRS